MKRDDSLDKSRWRAWAWGAQPDEADVDAPDEQTDEPGAEDAQAEDAAISRELLDTYAELVEQLWRERDAGGDRDRAVIVLRKALRVPTIVTLCALHPRAAVRAARLVVRHWGDEHDELRHGAYGLVFARLCHPEVADLVVEVARAGDLRLAWLVGQSVGDDFGRAHVDLSARLANVLEGARTWPAREIALAFLAAGGWAEAAPWMRRALRWPHLRCRLIALDWLMERDALRVDDVAWLLDDAVAHPIDAPSSRRDDEQPRYERTLLKAVLRSRPPDAHVTLERLARREGARIGRDRRYLARAWALEALAHLRPGAVIAEVDRTLRSGMSYERCELVSAAAARAEGDARPRLLALASDDVHHVAEPARRAWRERFGEACPVGALTGLPIELLDGPPSLEFEARVLVLRGHDQKARKAMTRVVLTSPPSRESLVLTLLVLRGYAWRDVEGMPDNDEGWVAWLRARHGDLALDGLLLEGERVPEARGRLRRVALLADEGSLSEEYVRRVTEVWLRCLRVEGEEPDDLTLLALRHLPVTDAVVAQLEPLLERPLRWYAAWTLAECLRARAPDAGLDARLAARFADARAARDWAGVERYGMACALRGLGPVVAQLLDEVWSVDAPDADEVLSNIASMLRGEKALTDDYLVDAMADPAAARFARVARWLPRDGALRARAIERLKLALAPTSPDNAAATALYTLLWQEELAVDDPVVAAVYERAPMKQRCSLLRARMGQALDDARPWQPMLAELLSQRDESVVGEALDLLVLLRRAEWDDDWIDATRPKVPEGPSRDAFAAHFRRETEAEGYWYRDDDE